MAMSIEKAQELVRRYGAGQDFENTGLEIAYRQANMLLHRLRTGSAGSRPTPARSAASTAPRSTFEDEMRRAVPKPAARPAARPTPARQAAPVKPAVKLMSVGEVYALRRQAVEEANMAPDDQKRLNLQRLDEARKLAASAGNQTAMNVNLYTKRALECAVA